MDFGFKQLMERESCTYTYFLWDKSTMEGLVIDPVIETLDRDMNVLEEIGIKLKYILETHVHADHITSAKSLRKMTDAKICLGADSGVNPDILLNDGQEVEFGSFKLKAILTPGHTDGCTSYHIDGLVFTGDTLLIRGCGRTDFQAGSNEKIFQSVREKLFALSDNTIVYPGHNYVGRLESTIKEEKSFNPRLKLENNFNDFKNIMDNLNLALPKKIKESVPANMELGK
jgi:sulfur dioxygenase